MEPVCRNRGICLGNRSLRTLLLIAWLSLWIQQTSGADVITAAVGETVTITSQFSGNIFTYTWYRGTAVLKNQAILTYSGPSNPQAPGPQYTYRETGLSNGSLYIRDVLTNYTGNYTVNITPPGESPQEFTKQLRVYVKVSIPLIYAVPKDPTENGSLVLFCNASGTDVSYQWFRDNNTVAAGGRISLTSNNQNLTLSPCYRSDTGTIFTCMASNAVSNSSSSPYNVIISYGPGKPVITALPAMPFHAVGSALNLSCTASSYPSALFTWLHNGQPLPSTGQDLYIRPLTLPDSGIYTCNASNQVTHLSSSADREIHVLEPVSIPVIDPVPQNPIENGSLTLSCNASGTAVSYEWYRAGTVVVSEGRISLTHNNQTLTLSPCKKSDTGTSFTCRAFNAVSNSSSRPYNVTISYGPDIPVISVNPEKEFYAEGSPLTLSCKAESYPPALYTWLHKGNSIVGQNITFNSLTLSDSGNYTCNSTNNVTHLSNYATWEIRVLEKVPKPIVRINNSQPTENQTVALTCGNSSSATTILWFFNNTLLQPDNNRLTLSSENRTLTISRISKSDDGSYQCEAQNPISRSISDPLTVTVGDPYGPNNLAITPQNVEIKLGNELRLTCTAASYPAAQYQWLHNNTNINNPESMYTKARSTYDDSGTYTCVASNSVTGLSANVSAIIKIIAPEQSSTGISGGAIAGIVIAVVVVLIVIGVIIWYFCFKQPASGAQKGEQTEMNGAPAASNPNAPASGKANVPAEDVQYTTVKFAPKTDKAAAAAAPEGTVYSEVRRK